MGIWVFVAFILGLGIGFVFEYLMTNETIRDIRDACKTSLLIRDRKIHDLKQEINRLKGLGKSMNKEELCEDDASERRSNSDDKNGGESVQRDEPGPSVWW